MSTTQELYIPPEDIHFRLVNYDTHLVLFSRNQSPEVGHYDETRESADQWFSLCNTGSGNNGQINIRSVYTGNYLFCRWASGDATAGVGHVGASRYEDTKFYLQPGKGKYTGYFRIVNNTLNTAIISRDPDLYVSPADNTWPGQYFTFLWEDMNIDKVEYDLNLGKIVNSTPHVIANQTIHNSSAEEQEMSFTVNEEETHTSTFDYTAGLTISMGTTFTAGVPLVEEAEISIDVSVSQEWSYGKSTSTTKTYATTFPVKAGPNETVKAVSTINVGNLEVPYTIYMSSKETGAKVQTNGIWRGVTTWDLRHNISTVPN